MLTSGSRVVNDAALFINYQTRVNSLLLYPWPIDYLCMMRRFVFIILLGWLLPEAVSAQPGWTIYNTSNSQLPENSVRCITIDNNGVKWIGTDYGLASFDDVTWTIYQTVNSGLPDNSIRSLAVDDLNNLWIGTFSGGLVQFNGTNWTVYNTFNSDLPDDFVRCLAVDTLNNVWIGTIGGLAYFDGTNWGLYNTSNSALASNNIGSLYVDHNDNGVAIGTINGGLAYFADTGSGNYNIWNSNLPDNTILGLDKDSAGVMWMATPAAGLSAHTGGFSFLTLNTASSTIASNSLTSISIAGNQDIWVSSNDSGIIKKSGLNFICYNTFNSPMPDDFVHTVLVDDQGIVWAGTLQGGLVRFDESLYLTSGELTVSHSIQLFPVPANENATIKCNSQKSFRILVTDPFGKTVIHNDNAGYLNTAIINTTALKTGSYVVKLLFEDGAAVSKVLVVVH